MRGFLAAMLVLTALPMPGAEAKDQPGMLRRCPAPSFASTLPGIRLRRRRAGRVAMEQPRPKSRLPGVAWRTPRRKRLPRAS